MRKRGIWTRARVEVLAKEIYDAKLLTEKGWKEVMEEKKFSKMEVIGSFQKMKLFTIALILVCGLRCLGNEDKSEQEHFEILENCVFVANEANDGDSFHISHNGQERFFRLYYVDSPESDDRLEERIQEQGKVFGLKPEEVLKAGKKAKKFTADNLSRGKFTVYTKWKDAKGASGMKRYFAFIKKGKEDYAETLVENGWARVYGASDVTPDGKSINETYGMLKSLQRKAKAARKGVWTSKNLKDLPED